MEEHWKAIAGYQGLYEVSDQGRVKSLKSGRWHNKQIVLKPKKNTCGYLQVGLLKDGKQKWLLVHRLVAEAFIPNPLNLETVNHKDEDKTNNAASNLEWMTKGDNNRYSKNLAVQMLDKSTGELLATFPSIREAHRVTGIDHSNISQCCLGKLKSAGGFKWRYVTETEDL